MNNTNQQDPTTQASQPNPAPDSFNQAPPNNPHTAQTFPGANMGTKFCTVCGSQLHIMAVVCPKCGCATKLANSPVNQQFFDSNSPGLNVLSFFFPIVGLILYFSLKDEKPIRAKGCSKFALIGFSIPLFFFLFALVFTSCTAILIELS